VALWLGRRPCARDRPDHGQERPGHRETGLRQGL